ncbi:MAG TPA: metallopeptidase TldD-related protein [Mobilitalea sp.]|nr:metallopeptidase TldD-related protein [Mobilitalea sp.]
MLERIIKLLDNQKEISGYKICEKEIEANELFFIKKNVDMDRAKMVRHYKLTVYVDFREDGNSYKGSATTNIQPTMSDEEITKAIKDAAFAAKFVKNPYYPLTKPVASYKKLETGKFNQESLPYWMNEITKAVYKNDTYDKAGINSCEIFLNKINTHIITSEGVDVKASKYEGMVEFITTWKEDGEEIELYRCLNFSDFEPVEMAEEVKTMIAIAKEKAIAKKTPLLENTPILLTRGAVKSFFDIYYLRSNASAVYNENSTWKIGDKLQGDEVKGDRITMTLDPFMKNSTLSGGFDEDGYALNKTMIIENGILKRYVADTRYAHYLNVEPTGMINNIIVNGGSRTMEELRKEPYLEIVTFSDFSVDPIIGGFCGEIRLAWYYDGEKTIPVTGGSISGMISDVHNEIYLSKELQKDNGFEGPVAVKMSNVSIAGVE